MVEAVAVEEPQTAPKPPQAATAAIATPPLEAPEPGIGGAEQVAAEAAARREPAHEDEHGQDRQVVDWRTASRRDP